jgi:hypothetical protein
MMKRLSLITLILLAASSLFAIGNGSNKVNTNVLQDKTGLQQTVNQFLDTVKAGNVEKIRSMYTTNYTFHGSGRQDHERRGTAKNALLGRCGHGANFL